MFLAVARTGPSTLRLKRLGVNHATLSRRVTTLEERLKTRLLDYAGAPMAASLRPRRDVSPCRRAGWNRDAARARANLGHLDSSIAGTVRIGAPDGFGVSFLYRGWAG